MDTTQSLKISKEQQIELQHLSDLLHLFHHRNKNQHRRSIWYRHFSVFHKQLNALLSDLSKITQIPTTNLARTQKKKRCPQIIETTTKRLAFWRDVLVPKWQHAFSQVVADGRFSVLGLVLLAALSQVCQVVGVAAELGELGQVEIERVLEEFGREEWGGEVESARADGFREDQGEIVQRVEEVSATESVKTNLSLEKKRPSEATSKRSSKKRQTRRDAIDDIFG